MGTTATSSTSTPLAWEAWNQQLTSSTTGSIIVSATGTVQWGAWNTAYEETAEEAAAREERNRVLREAAEQARAEAEERNRVLREAAEQAQARAEELLEAMLSDEQAASRRDSGFFTVRGSSSGAAYRIHNKGITGNVDRLDGEGRREVVFCAHPPAGIPVADVHLAQMLSLVTDEDAFLRVANVLHRNVRRQVTLSNTFSYFLPGIDFGVPNWYTVRDREDCPVQ
jgi:hypothetical protein